jgi:signal transduction histidine kinase
MTRQRERTPALLRAFADALGKAGLDEDALVKAAVTSCKALLQAEQCSVWLVDSAKTKLVLRHADGYGALACWAQLEYPLVRPAGEQIGITAWIYQHQKPVSADSYTELKSKPGYRGNYDPELHGVRADRPPRDEDHPCRQFYGGPISLGEDQFGVLKVENKITEGANEPPRFSEADRAALDTVAAMLAMALKHARAGAEAKEELDKYHGYTVHSMRNELMPVETGLTLIRRLANWDPKEPIMSRADLRQPIQLLSMGTQNLQFYLEHLLKFLHPKIDPSQMVAVPISQILKDEVWLLSEVAREYLEAKLIEDPKGPVCVRGDVGFLAAAMKELLRNARKAIFRRQEQEKREYRTPTRGIVVVQVETRVPEHGSSASEVVIGISDNGDAAVGAQSGGARALSDLERAWKQTRATLTKGGKVGLSFVQWVVGEHHGRVELSHELGMTKFRIHLPTSVPDPRD